MTPSPQRPLSYPTQKQVFLFLSLAPRRSLASHCPETRNWQRKFPFRFENIEAVWQPRIERIEDRFPQVISIDGVVWSFYPYPMECDKVILPNGETRTCDYNYGGLWNSLLKYYLNREGTQVHSLRIQDVSVNFDWHLDQRIWNMTIHTNGRLADLDSLFYLRDKPMEKLHLDFNMVDWTTTDFYDFDDGHIKAKEFKLDVAKFQNFSDFHIISDNCDLFESEADHLKFVERCRELMKYPIGSKYTCAFTDKTLSIYEIWMIIKQGLGDGVKVRYTDKIPGLYVPIDESKELFIHSREIEFSPQIFRTHFFYLKVQEAGKSNPYHQLSLRQKLDHWNYRRHELVLRIITNLEVSIVKWWFGIDLVSWTPKRIKKHKQFDKLFRSTFETTKPLCIFDNFKNMYFNKVVLLALDDTWLEEDSEQLRNCGLHTDLLTLEVGIFSCDLLSTNFEFAKVIILRQTSECEFLEGCQEFMAGKYPIGSEYRDTFCYDCSFDWEWLKDGLDAEIKYRNGVCGMCVPINSETELFITGAEAEFSNLFLRIYRFTASIQKAKSSVAFQEMSIREKLCYWNHRRRHFVLDKFIEFEIPFARKWYRFNYRRIQDEDGDEYWRCQNPEKVHDSFNRIRCYRVLVPILLSEILISILSVRMFHSLSPFIILIPLFLIINYFYFRNWYYEKKDSYIPVMPPK